tara:strand:- start:5134 stop:5721 length:588 start_codon:yes stop_codon:yes gene_type:complete
MNKDFAFILGNGITRLEIDCAGLLDYGTVYGCNRIYEEFAPNVLVSTDAGMAQEIQQSGYSASNIHYTRSHHKIRNSGAHVLPKDIHGYSSGPAALALAAQSEANYLFLIGMDLKGVNNKINNIYAGTQHYKPKNADAMYFGNWVDQLNRIIQQTQNKRFMQVNPLNNFTDDSLRKNSNFETMSLDEFKRMINKL